MILYGTFLYNTAPGKYIVTKVELAIDALKHLEKSRKHSKN